MQKKKEQGCWKHCLAVRQTLANSAEFFCSMDSQSHPVSWGIEWPMCSVTVICPQISVSDKHSVFITGSGIPVRTTPSWTQRTGWVLSLLVSYPLPSCTYRGLTSLLVVVVVVVKVMLWTFHSLSYSCSKRILKPRLVLLRGVWLSWSFFNDMGYQLDQILSAEHNQRLVPSRLRNEPETCQINSTANVFWFLNFHTACGWGLLMTFWNS
jgi:hypothetical protein